MNFLNRFLFLLPLLFCSCASGPPRRGAPVFVAPASVPVGIRLVDKRPSKQVEGGKQRDGFYPKVTSESAFVRLADDLATAMTLYGAAGRCYRLRGDHQPPLGALVLHVEVRDWYGRWPANVPREAKQVLVEGDCVLKWKLVQNRNTLASGKAVSGLEDLPVPLKALQPNTVDTVINAAVRNQMIQSARRSIEGMLLTLSDDWSSLNL